MDPKIDRNVFRDLSYGLYIVASRHEGRASAQVVNTVIQVTSDPPRVAVIINKKNFTHELIVKSRVFSASVLEESAPMAFFGPSVSSREGTSTNWPRRPSRRALADVL